MSSKPDLLDQVLEAVKKDVTIENSCCLLIAVDALLSSSNVNEMVGFKNEQKHDFSCCFY